MVNLPTPEIQVTLTGAPPSDLVQRLLRDAAGQVRVADTQSVGAGKAVGSATVPSIPLPRLAPTEGEFASSRVRADRALDHTVWRPGPRRP